MRTAAGEWRWILARGKVVRRDDAGRPLRMSGIQKDITERKHAREALLRSEALIRAILETAPDGVITINEQGQIESFNEGCREHLRLFVRRDPGQERATPDAAPGTRGARRALGALFRDRFPPHPRTNPRGDGLPPR